MEQTKQIMRTVIELFKNKALLRAALFLGIIAVFFALADEVRDTDTLTFDELVLTSLNAASTPFWDGFFVFVTQLGGVLFVGVVSALLAAFLWLKKKWRSVSIVVFGMGGMVVLNVLLKFLFERPRPDLWEQLVVEESFSFPSGHAMASMALAIVIGYVLVRSKLDRHLVIVLIGLLVLYVILIGISRLYLGVHYPTDIVGGWLISSAWLLVVIPLAWRIRFPHNKATLKMPK